MATITNEDQLTTELEELYLMSKHWLSDIEFLEIDLVFFKKLFGINVSMLVKNDEFKTIAATLISIAKSSKEQDELKAEVKAYLHKLEQLITHADKGFEVDLIETYNKLEARLYQAVKGLKAIKEDVHALSKSNV